MKKINITNNLFRINHLLYLKIFFCILNIFISFKNDLNAFQKKRIEINKHNMCQLDQLDEYNASKRNFWAEIACELYDSETYLELQANKLYPIFVLKGNPDKIFKPLRHLTSKDKCDPNLEIKDYCAVIDKKFLSSNDSLSTLKKVCLKDPLYDNHAIYKRLLWVNNYKYLNSEEIFNLTLKRMYPSLVSLSTYEIIKDLYGFFEKNKSLSPQELYIHSICPKQ